MQAVQQHLAECQAQFAQHPFFSYLAADADVADVMCFAPNLTFWVMTFQDVLRLNEGLVTDPELKKIARHHRREDAGHDRWFLEDLKQLGASGLELSTLFGPAHATTRDAAFKLVAESYRAESDAARVVLLLSLESTGHIFFDRVSRYLAAKPINDKLRYFSDFHLRVEQAHALFEVEMERVLWARTLTEAERAEAISLVDRVFDAFDTMFNGLVTLMEARGLKPAAKAA